MSKRLLPNYRIFILLPLLVACPTFLHAQNIFRPEEIEWTWEVRPTSIDPTLPNVLIVGDSISRNYYPDVAQALKGNANVYLFTASTSLGDPRLNTQLNEFAAMEGISFQVIHFNNGMHGWKYSEAEYAKAIPSYLKTIQSIAPKARLIWATTTPVRNDDPNGPTNMRIELRNQEAEKALSGHLIAVDDQHRLMLNHSALHQDAIHFNAEGAELQAQQVTAAIENALTKEPFP